MIGRPCVVVAPTSSDNSIAVMRQLRAAGIGVVGADDGYLPTWLRSRHCRHYHRVPGANDLTVTDYLPEIVATTQPDAILPVNTPATLATILHRPAFGASVRTNLPPTESFFAAYDKSICLAACRRLGIPCPDEYDPPDAAARLRRSAGGLRLVVKPRVDFGGGHGLRIVADEASLQEAVSDCEHHFGGAVIQEFIPGDTSRLAMLLVLYGPDGRLAAAFTSRKRRQYPALGGSATVSESTADIGLLAQMLPLFEYWHWRGPAEVDVKFDERDGTYKVLEVNPRFPSYLRFVVECGLDLPGMAALLALDPAAVVEMPFPAYAVGRRYVCPGPFVRGLIDDLLRPGARLRRLGESLCEARGVWAAGVCDDPLPFIGRLLSQTRQ
jgi:predicted ATP-grasp superfamily ATP-dependent carboligase